MNEPTLDKSPINVHIVPKPLTSVETAIRMNLFTQEKSHSSALSAQEATQEEAI